ncbi:MAG: alpha/beta hydrolase [Pseudomonadales bacterium]
MQNQRLPTTTLLPFLLLSALTLTGCGADDPGPTPNVAPDTAAAPAEDAAATAVPIEETLLPGIRMHFVDSNGIRLRVAEMGEGPVVLLAHGWPESWYSWRHQIRALAAAGYRVLAPDMRGYGASDAPGPEEDYNLVTLAADMVGILDAFAVTEATMVGHDWGAPVATHSVLLHPERFNGLIIMSVPYGGRAPNPPMAGMRSRVGDNFFYILYHNEPNGVAEAEYDADPRGLLSRLYLSPDSPREAPEVTDPKRAAGGWIPRLGAAKGLPDWLTQQDLDYYVSQVEDAGFRGGVNYYRNIGRNWELTENLAGASVRVPTLFIAGDKDIVIGGATQADLEGMMKPVIPELKGVLLIPGIGHWVQQEAPEQTSAAILEFLADLHAHRE